MERATATAGAELAGERIAPANGIELAYEELGDPAGEPMVLIMGLATQMIFWDVELCELFGERGYRVIRFDNRDIGHSTKLDAAGVPRNAEMMLGYGRPAYRLADMAADTMGLLDHLEIERAHLVGASMGGMIAQQLAIDHPERALSLCSIMSATGNRRYRFPRWRAFAALMAKPASSREAYIEQAVKTFKVIGSPAYPMDEPHFRDACRARLRPLLSSAGGRAPAARDQLLGQPDPAAARARPAGARRPWHRRPVGAAGGRTRDRGVDPRRAAVGDRGHGARPPGSAARAVRGRDRR